MGGTELAVAIGAAIVFAILFAPLGDWVTKSRRNLWLLLLTKTLLRRRRIRISCGALLNVGGSPGYVLARMKLRPDAFGPFGGAYKYTMAGASELAAMGFEPQSLDVKPGQDIVGDLRGSVPADSGLAAFVGWFQKGTHRDSDSECLRRELIEELHEVSEADLVPYVASLELSFVREVHEGPYVIPGDDGYQLRLLRIYELNANDNTSRAFGDELVRRSAINPHLLLASEREIRQGRGPRSSAIGHHAGYLFGQRRVRPDLPPF
jgi:hypothetical protein